MEIDPLMPAPPDDGAAEFPDGAKITPGAPPSIEDLLKPGSPLHGKLLSRIKARKELSERVMKGRHEEYRRIDQTRRMFVNLASPARRGDGTVIPGKREMPFERAIVMPLSYSILETRRAEAVSQYAYRAPFTQFDGRGPEDQKPAKLAEVKIEYDYQQSDGLLAVYQLWGDADAYGVGIIHDHWEEQQGWVTTQPDPMMVEAAATFGLPPPPPTTTWGPISQFTRWSPVDVYSDLPDPRVSRSRIQDGEFHGHKTFRSFLWLLERDQKNGGMYFNLEALKKQGSNEAGGETRISGADSTRGMDTSEFSLRSSNDERDKGYYVLANMQIKLVPKDWELGPEDKPEVWWFAVADDRIIVRAHKTPHNHGQLTYAVGESNFDAHQHSNPGTGELMDGIQRTNDWLVNSRIENVRKFLNDMIAFSPEMMEQDDIMNPGTARWLRTTLEGTRYLMQNGGGIDQFLKQIDVKDVTGTHFEISQFLMDMANKLGAANDTMQGQNLPDKRTLGEINNAVSAGSKRITITARVLDSMVFKPLAMRSLMNAQQFYKLEQWVRIGGDYAELDPDSLGRIQISAADMAGNFDYVPMTALTPQDPARMMSVWNQLFSLASTTPALSMPDPLNPQVLDIKKLFQQVARLGGAREIDSYFKDLPMMMEAGAPGVLPDQQIEQGVQAGNLVPIQ